MVFSSITFLFYFLPIVLAIYYIVPQKAKNYVLLISSFIFYFYGEPKYVVLMAFSIVSAYILAIFIDKSKEKDKNNINNNISRNNDRNNDSNNNSNNNSNISRNNDSNDNRNNNNNNSCDNKTNYAKLFLIICICINIGFLVYFKYINFIIENINLWLKNKIDFIYVALPIGISFYTFQLLSYVIDVYKGNAKVQKNIFKLSMYVSLFPQLIAGPIVRYTTIENQLDSREHSIQKFAQGIRRFVIGLGKKVLLANVLGELNTVFSASTDNTLLGYWLYAISITLQIYFDFSGYSDMAIGLGKMFGFDFLENFNYPYIATSITDFWRRWHISLSTWFRDYIYIPLGGNRVSKIKWVRNLLIVWLLTGLWHGADWNFVLWGLYFAVFLIIEKLFLEKFLKKLPKILSRIYVLILVMISFIIFNAESTNQIVLNIGGFLGITSTAMFSQESVYYLKSYAVIILIGIIGATPVLKNIATSQKMQKVTDFFEPIFLVIVMLLSTSYIIDSSFNPFLYFRF